MSSQTAPRKRYKTRKRQQQRIFQRKDQWLGKEPGRATYFRYWYEPGKNQGTGRVRRKSLGTEDLDEAIRRLIELVDHEAPADPTTPDLVLMNIVLQNYIDNHVHTIRAKVPAKRSCALITEYMRAAVGPTYKVSDFNLPRQHAFIRHLAAKGLSAKTISTYLSTIKAAVNFAARPRLLVDSKGHEREGRMLSAPIFVQADEGAISKITNKPRSEPRSFCPSLEQLARFIDAIDGDGFNQDSGRHAALFRYVIIALNTWARPEAITELNVREQVDFQHGLVRLNPPGRTQNKKFRPTIRLTDNLRGWLLYWNLDKPIIRGVPGAHRRYGNHGAPIKHIGNATTRKVAAAAGVPGITPYTIRHFMATKARAMPGFPVSREERAVWLGHSDPAHRQTLWYEHQDMDYLENAAKATDAIMSALDGLCRKSLFAPGIERRGHLTVVKSTADAPFRDEDEATG
jgi:integrase